MPIPDSKPTTPMMKNRRPCQGVVPMFFLWGILRHPCLWFSLLMSGLNAFCYCCCVFCVSFGWCLLPNLFHELIIRLGVSTVHRLLLGVWKRWSWCCRKKSLMVVSPSTLRWSMKCFNTLNGVQLVCSNTVFPPLLCIMFQYFVII